MTISLTVARLAVSGALFTCLLACPHAQGQKTRTSQSPTDYWRSVQAQQAADYYRYARKQQNTSGYNQYGHFGPAFERIDGMLAQNRQHFTDYEINDVSSRIYGLKQRIASSVAQGFQTHQFQDDVSSLEAEISRKVSDSLANISSVEQHLHDTLSRVEQLFSAHRNKMPDSDYEELENRIRRLRDRSTRETLVTNGVGSNNDSADFADEARKIESAIIGKSLLHRPEPQDSNNDAEAQTNAKAEKAPPQKEASSPVHSGGLSSYRLEPTPTRQPLPPTPSLAAVFDKTENRLLNLHEAEQLGTFDIDIFSERVLKLKLNTKKMAAKTGKLSKRQEDWLRVELDKLNEEISERTHSTE
ncbi:MAG: hypothetical protein K2W95_11620 [Candidatus Obscuribacterales bacterium]|nr:hypothetical protein [Candidatus Obscuribacterales bacterium]